MARKKILKRLVGKIKKDMSALQKADLRRVTKALDTLKRDVQRLESKVKSCDYTLGLDPKAR